MAYKFQNQNVAKFNLGGDLDPHTLSFNGITGDSESDGSEAQTIVNGIKGLLWICGEEASYNYESGIRTVKQNVIDD